MAVTCLRDFIASINALAPPVDSVLIYRGHADGAKFQLLPSVLREDKFKNAEHEIVRELVATHPNEFSADGSSLEQLARVQHYSLPTRLLDVSWNPLVALFFATNEYEHADGEVIVLRVRKRYVKFYDSDTASCIANLAHLSPSEKGSIDFSLAAVEFNDQAPVDRLLQFIRVEKPYFRARIVPGDLQSVIAVKPKLSHRRLVSQSGAFLLFGLVGALDLTPAAGIAVERIQIASAQKGAIQQELDRLAINSATMFPEIDKAATYIRQKL